MNEFYLLAGQKLADEWLKQVSGLLSYKCPQRSLSVGYAKHSCLAICQNGSTQLTLIENATIRIKYQLDSVCHTGVMTTEVPISHHLDLYRYWDGRRNGRRMPARRDIDPADIPGLLPHVSLIHKPDGQFRFRLVGSAAGTTLDAT